LPPTIATVTSRLLQKLALALAALAAGGCATIGGNPLQDVSIQTVDAGDRPIAGMRCHAVNGAAEYFGNSPMFNLEVRRSASDLEIECRRGNLVARGTAVSRGKGLLAGVLPGGTAAIVIDHISGYRYSYPSWIQLRVGEHLVFDASDDTFSRPVRGLQADTPR
jgi:hypothetical protein